MKRLIAVLLILVAAPLAGCVADTDRGYEPSSSYDPEPAAADYDTDYGGSDPDIQRAALDIVWDDASYSDQALMCDGVETFGVDWSVRQFMQGAESGTGDFEFDESIVRSWLLGNC